VVTVIGENRLTFESQAAPSAEPPTIQREADASKENTIAGGPRVAVIADDLVDVTDVAATVDGRAFVAERHGAVRMWSPENAESTTVLTLDDVVTERGTGLLSVALAPDYERTGYVYVGYTTATGFRVARYRDLAGTWAERAILFETQPDSVYTAAVVRFGPEGRLYVALDDEGNPQARVDLGSLSGKVLRLNRDGSVPDDQPGYSPIHVADVRRPRGLGWTPVGDRLWIANGADAEAGSVDVARLDMSSEPRAARRVVVARYSFPDGDVPGAVALYRGEAFKLWDGDLLVGLLRSEQLLRLDLDPADPDAVTSSDIVLDGTYGPIRAMTVAPDGTLVVASERQLLRLAP